MSLLLIFFVFLVSFSQMDLAKFKELAGSLEQALGAQRPQLVPIVPSDTLMDTVKFQERVGVLAHAPTAQHQASASTMPQPSIPATQDVAPLVAGSERLQAPAQALESVASSEPSTSAQTVTVSQLAAPQPPDSAPQDISTALQATAAELQALLTTFAPQGLMELEAQDHYLVMRLLGQTTFASGKADLRPEVLSTLRAIGEVIRQTPYEIFVAGHTDDVPVHGSVFKSNLELSAARAAVVVDFFVHYGFISPARIATMGFGEYRPLVPNTSEANREQNRRVEIILTARPARASAPSPAQPSPAVLLPPFASGT
jgi:chemotaxis protein MotB